MDYLPWWFDPFVVVREAGVSVDGAEDHVAGNRHFHASFENAVEGSPQIFLPVTRKPHGMDMTVQGTIIQPILARDARNSGPISILLFDFLAIRTAADGAFAAVAL